MQRVIPNSRIPAAVLAAVLLVVSSSCKKEESGPEPVVERFLQALNEKDVNTMLTCIDPKQERMFRASFRLAEKLTGGKLPMEDLLELIPGLYQIFQDRIGADFNYRNVQVYRAKANGGDAEVPVMLTASTRKGALQNDQVQRVRFVMRQFDDGWRIVGIQQ